MLTYHNTELEAVKCLKTVVLMDFYIVFEESILVVYFR